MFFLFVFDNFCVFALGFLCHFLVLLASVLCPLEGKFGPGACVVFQVGGTSAYVLVGVLSLFLLMVRAMLDGVC